MKQTENSGVKPVEKDFWHYSNVFIVNFEHALTRR